jgi:hypothetical protein
LNRLNRKGASSSKAKRITKLSSAAPVNFGKSFDFAEESAAMDTVGAADGATGADGHNPDTWDEESRSDARSHESKPAVAEMADDPWAREQVKSHTQVAHSLGLSHMAHPILTDITDTVFLFFCR